MHTLDRKAPSVSNRTSFLQATGVQRLLLFHITGRRGSAGHGTLVHRILFSAKNAISRCGVHLNFLSFARHHFGTNSPRSSQNDSRYYALSFSFLQIELKLPLVFSSVQRYGVGKMPR
jgi:hypothetical protein